MKKILLIITLALCALQVNVNAQTLIADYPVYNTNLEQTGTYGNFTLAWNPVNPQVPDTTYSNGVCINGIGAFNPGGQQGYTKPITALDTSDFEVHFDFVQNSNSSNSFILGMTNDIGAFYFSVYSGQVYLVYDTWDNLTHTTWSNTYINTGQWYSVRIKHYLTTTQVIINGNVAMTIVTDPMKFSNSGATLNKFIVNPGFGGFNGCLKNLKIYNHTVIIATPPSGITVNSDQSGNCGANVSFPPLDAVGAASLTTTYSDSSGTFFSIGNHPVKVVASNSFASDSATFNVLVVDTDPPFFTYCPPNITLTPISGTCFTGTTALIGATASDCSGNILPVTSDAPSIFPIGKTDVSYIASNANGINGCLQIVTVADTYNPILNCHPDTTVYADSGQCSKVVTFDPPTVDDCCILPTGHIPGFSLIPKGIFGGHSYFFNPTQTDASTANATAVAAGGHLLTINSDDEQSFIEQKFFHAFWWMGGYQYVNDPNYSEPDGGWKWLTDEPFSYTHWKTGYPNNAGGANNMLFDAEVGSWIDTTYNAIAYSIIEFECTNTPVVTSGNPSGSSFPAGTSTVTYQATDLAGNTGTCSFTVTVIETEPPVISCPANITVNAPTGYCQALVNYALPLVTDNCSTPPTSVLGLNYLGSYGGHTYFTIGNTNTWSGANAVAISRGGSLVSINDAGENAFLQSVLSFGNFWTGGFQNHASGSYTEPSGGWEWLDGSNFNSYTNWGASQPDNSFGVEDNLIYNASTGTWFDNYTNNTFVQAIVEFSSNIVPVLIAGQPSGSVFNAGTTTNTYVATDASGNSASCSFTVTVIGSGLSAEIGISNSISCFGECDGSLRAKTLAGISPFTFLWNTGSTTRKIKNLCKNDYTVTVTDAVGCSVVVTRSLYQPTELKVIHVKTSVTSHNANDGTIIFTTKGGIPPYTYLWNDGYTSGTRTNISPGHYTITITDAHGCSKTVVKNWTNPAIGTRLQNSSEDNFISVYPNPSDGMFTINFETESHSTFIIEVTDLQGRLVYKNEAVFGENNQFILDLKNMSKGIYLLKISNDDFNEMQKLVIE